MRFYVVKSNSNKVNIRSKKCYCADNLTTAYAKFSIDILNKEANYIFLIADFEDRESTFFNRIKLEDNDNPLLPYFIIAFYDSSIDINDPTKCIRHDSTRIVFSDGIIREFNDNFSAFREYQKQIMDPGIGTCNIEFCINYRLDDKSNDTSDNTVYTRTIDNSNRMMLFSERFKVSRFKFDVQDLCNWNSFIRI